ncbi:glycerophosphodiester phosphodiesterase family protein [Mucilaginibacter litoreus]|uniref:Glycerophosphodiester phosphodiesterase family protein n=1 Tax=Mucilaginibacter litoreus TaxID=1048221 RepID=A0ABW3ATZ9_9SPHI
MKYSLTLLFVILSSFKINAQPNPIPKPKHQFTVIAHRGDHVKYPENTLEAYLEAIKNGADYVEIDLRTTKDSVLISMHDGNISRMTGEPGNIKDLTFETIRSLKVQSKNTQDTTAYHIPAFEDILKTCKDKIYIYLDFKDASVPATYAALRKYHMEKQVIVYINSFDQLERWRKLAPKIPLMLSLPDSAKNINDIKAFIHQTHPDVLDGNWKTYNTEMLEYLTSQRIPVWPDIQSANEDQHWPDAVKLGFKSLQTDHPAALIEYLTKKGLR